MKLKSITYQDMKVVGSMSIEERQALVATVQETYALMGRSLGADIPDALFSNAIRADLLNLLQRARIDPYVTEPEMLPLLLETYYELVESVLRLSQTLLGDSGEGFDAQLAEVGLSGNGLQLKVRGFRRSFVRALSGVPGFRWIKKTFEWGNIILGSLGAVPGIGLITEPIHELKIAIEAQGDEENGS